MKKISIILALAAIVVACGRKDSDFDASGLFEATEIVVSSQVSGQLVRLDVTEGDELAAGQAVGLVDTIQLSLKIKQLQASIAAVGSRRTDVTRQIAVTQQQIATQQVEQQRFTKLVADDAANRKQLDDITSAIALLEKQLDAQRSTMERGNRSLGDEAESMCVQIEQARDQLARSTVSAPAAGTVTAKYAEAGEMASAGRPLFKLADMQDVFLRAYATGDQVTRLKIGQAVKVYADFGQEGYREYAGRITWISSRAEFTPKSIQTRDERADQVYAMKVAVQNDGFLKIGMYGQLKFGQDK